MAGRKFLRREPGDSALRRFSALVGIALIGVAVLWFIWLLVRQVNTAVPMPATTLPLPHVLPQSSPTAQDNPLASAGITLSSPGGSQTPRLTQQQAILLADQMQPEVAAHAGKVEALYTLFSYRGSNPDVASFQNDPVWLVHYSNVSEPPAATSADPHASSTHHDFYVFLDANSGRELLAIWL
ncbi:MAG TPA: hypothetical protein VKV19_09590 [Ktedonobacteraceae bacterium]|nr:hypothetical protein [Ktedonobacteraceae bacterium]